MQHDSSRVSPDSSRHCPRWWVSSTWMMCVGAPMMPRGPSSRSSVIWVTKRWKTSGHEQCSRSTTPKPVGNQSTRRDGRGIAIISHVTLASNSSVSFVRGPGVSPNFVHSIIRIGHSSTLIQSWGHLAPDKCSRAGVPTTRCICGRSADVSTNWWDALRLESILHTRVPGRPGGVEQIVG